MQPEMQFLWYPTRGRILMSDEDILQAISAFPSNVVILTGGEPSLWIDQTLSICYTWQENIFASRLTGQTRCRKASTGWPVPRKGFPWADTYRWDQSGLYRTGPDGIRRFESNLAFPPTCSCLNTKRMVVVHSHPPPPMAPSALQTHKLIDISWKWKL